MALPFKSVTLGRVSNRAAKFIYRQSMARRFSFLDLPIEGDYWHQKISWRSAARAGAHQLPFRAEVFDSILSIDVVEHLKTPSSGLKETQSSLEKRGVLCI